MAKYSDFDKAVITEFARVANVVFNHVREELAKVPSLCGSYTVAQLGKSEDIARLMEGFSGWAECTAVDPDTWAVRIAVGSSVYTCPVWGLFRVFSWMETATGCKSGARFDVVPAVDECVRVSFDVLKGADKLAQLTAGKNEIREQMRHICIMHERGEAWATNGKTLGRAHLGEVLTVGTMPEGVKAFAVRPEFWKKCAGHRVTLTMEEGGRVLAMTDDGQTCEAVAVGRGVAAAFNYPNVHSVARSTADRFELTKAEAVAVRKFAQRAKKNAYNDEKINITCEAGRVVWRFNSDTLTAGTVSEFLTFTGEVLPEMLAVSVPGVACVGFLPGNNAPCMCFVDACGVLSGVYAPATREAVPVDFASLEGVGVPSFLDAASEAVDAAPVAVDSVPEVIPEDVAPVTAAPEAVTVDEMPEDMAPEAVAIPDSVPAVPEDVAPVAVLDADSVPECVDAAPVQAAPVPVLIPCRADNPRGRGRLTFWARRAVRRAVAVLVLFFLLFSGHTIGEAVAFMPDVLPEAVQAAPVAVDPDSVPAVDVPDVAEDVPEASPEDVAPVQAAPVAVAIHDSVPESLDAVPVDSVPDVPEASHEDVATVQAVPVAVAIADSVSAVPEAVTDAPVSVDADSVPVVPEAVTAAPVSVDADSVPAVPEDVTAAPVAVDADSVPVVPESVTAAPVAVDADSVPAVPEDVTASPVAVAPNAGYLGRILSICSTNPVASFKYSSYNILPSPHIGLLKAIKNSQISVSENGKTEIEFSEMDFSDGVMHLN